MFASVTFTRIFLPRIFGNISKINAYAASSLLNNLVQDLNKFSLKSTGNLIHTSPPKLGLDEFFDSKENWGVEEVKVGRSWKKEELRLKSNSDLHKLWYVLLKEKNMLLTMEKACKQEFKLFPNPERIDKVQDSMNNLEEVVKERNRAYWLLETGEVGGERPCEEITDQFGRHMKRQFSEFPVPDHMHNKVKYNSFNLKPLPTFFNRLLKERHHNKRKGRRMRRENYIKKVFIRYPDANLEDLQKEYPDIDIHKLKDELNATKLY